MLPTLGVGRLGFRTLNLTIQGGCFGVVESDVSTKVEDSWLSTSADVAAER